MDAEFYLPYWKQGDDFNHYLENHKNVVDALEAHARDMDFAAAKLRELRAEVAGHDVHMLGCVHHIELDGDDDLIKRLAKKQLVQLCPVYDDGDDEEEVEQTSEKD